jgi:Holliday junction resolvasome RuvABC endonuclease subunit
VSPPLALDLGTTTGFACGEPGIGAIVSSTWNLKPARFDGGGMRYVKFRQRLDELHAAMGFEIVYFEEVRRHAGTDAAHVYGGLMATLQSWCEDKKIAYSGVPVGTIKKFWTGKGNAPKDVMIAKARERGFEPDDDNEADALALLHWVFADQRPAGVMLQQQQRQPETA